MKIRYRVLVLAGSLFVAMGLQASSDRFNSIKSGMSRTNSVTAQSQTTPSGGAFNSAVQDQDSKYSARYDDTALLKADSDLQKNIDSLRSYVNSRDASYYNSSKSYSNSAASGAESRAKSHANTKATQAENNAESYALSIATSRAATAESNAKSYGNSKASQVETNSLSYASNVSSTTNAFLRNEIQRLEDMISDINVCGSGGGDDGGTDCRYDLNHWVEVRKDMFALGTATWTARSKEGNFYRSGTNLMTPITQNGITFSMGKSKGTTVSGSIETARYEICLESDAPPPETVTYSYVVTNDYLCYEGGGWKKEKYWGAVYKVPYEYKSGAWVKGTVDGAPLQVTDVPDSYTSVECIGNPLPVQP
ncbi:hypothetical protein [Vibrio owensii]|uniref:hypothetical protein n=1 Tax=Vibrio owensii TaxID=696485 RepID=UPI0018F2060D|nr:hypothetical protein [Vibrio owensii]